jgi:hypothetical protein
MLDNSPKRIREKSAKYGCEMWQLRTPLTCHKITDIPYGLDNGCFSGNLKHKTWVRMLDEAGDNREKSYLLFVTLPDVVGSARRTLELFEMYEPQTNGLPRCLVLQDGIADVTIPWSRLAAVFVGGTDQFKIDPACMAAVKCAKLLGKWVHIGREMGAYRARERDNPRAELYRHCGQYRRFRVVAI